MIVIINCSFHQIYRVAIGIDFDAGCAEVADGGIMMGAYYLTSSEY